MGWAYYCLLGTVCAIFSWQFRWRDVLDPQEDVGIPTLNELIVYYM